MGSGLCSSFPRAPLSLRAQSRTLKEISSNFLIGIVPESVNLIEEETVPNLEFQQNRGSIKRNKLEKESLFLSGRKERGRQNKVEEKKNKISLTSSISLGLLRGIDGNVLVGVETVEKNVAKSNERDGVESTSESSLKDYIFHKQCIYYEEFLPPHITTPFSFKDMQQQSKQSH